MVSFMHKLRNLPENYMMNSVLENFTVLQVTYSRHIYTFHFICLICMRATTEKYITQTATQKAKKDKNL